MFNFIVAALGLYCIVEGVIAKGKLFDFEKVSVTAIPRLKKITRFCLIVSGLLVTPVGVLAPLEIIKETSALYIIPCVIAVLMYIAIPLLKLICEDPKKREKPMMTPEERRAAREAREAAEAGDETADAGKSELPPQSDITKDDGSASKRFYD